VSDYSIDNVKRLDRYVGQLDGVVIASFDITEPDPRAKEYVDWSSKYSAWKGDSATAYPPSWWGGARSWQLPLLELSPSDQQIFRRWVKEYNEWRQLWQGAGLNVPPEFPPPTEESISGELSWFKYLALAAVALYGVYVFRSSKK
jgi:hypothetical protein